MFGSHGMYDPNVPVTPKEETPLADQIEIILKEEVSFMEMSVENNDRNKKDN